MLTIQNNNQTVWAPVKELGPFILWCNNERGSLLRFTYTRMGSDLKPEDNLTSWMSRTSAEIHLESLLAKFIRNRQADITMMTQRQQKALIKKVEKRGL